jgi:hypothetical protein
MVSLLSDFVDASLAIMSFPWSFSVLGYVGGVIITLGMALIVLYTSYICWQFCMAYVFS